MQCLGRPACDAFDGMFALAIYDKNKGELFLASDRAGKKPTSIIFLKGGQANFCK
jgi:asparagine synthetase B (glutamine-hydrolysing)